MLAEKHGPRVRILVSKSWKALGFAASRFLDVENNEVEEHNPRIGSFLNCVFPVT